MQDWAQEEGIKWVFHTSRYSQASNRVEQTNGLIKRYAGVSHHNWDTQLPQAVSIVNNRWESDGNPEIRAFCPTGPLTIVDPIPESTRD